MPSPKNAAADFESGTPRKLFVNSMVEQSMEIGGSWIPNSGNPCGTANQTPVTK
jgi:hypothetical protein